MRFKSFLQNARNCHSEEVAAATDEESRIAWQFRAKFIASLRMTGPEGVFNQFLSNKIQIRPGR
jgi:hypothetical protein